MKGVILAVGSEWRFLSLSKITNRHLHPIGNGKYPMVFYPIAAMKQAGIQRIMLITDPFHIGDLIELLGSGAEWDLKFSYQVQKKSGGPVAALELAEEFAAGERLLVMEGDNLFEAELRSYLEGFRRQKSGMKLFLKEVDNPSGRPVARLRDEKVVALEEKTGKYRSNLCITGIYCFDETVFEIIRRLRRIGRNEPELPDLIRTYIQRGDLSYELLDGWWMDTGAMKSLDLVDRLLKDLTLDL